MAITYQSVTPNAPVFAFTTAATPLTISPAYPTGIVAGDIVILFVAQKPSVANGGTVTTPAGWTLLNSLLAAGGYGATLGAGTGNTNLRCYYRVATGALTGTQLITLTVNNVAWAVIQYLRNASGIWDIAASSGSKVSETSPMAIAAAFVAGTANDYVLSAFSAANNTPAYSAETYTQTGLTYGTRVEVGEPKTTVGNRLGGVLVRAPITAGTSTAGTIALGATITTPTGSRGPAIYVRIREIPATSVIATAGSIKATGTINSVLTAFPASTGSGVVQATGTINSVTIQSNINLSIGSGVVQATGAIGAGYSVKFDYAFGSGVVQTTGAIGAGYSVKFDYALGSGVVQATGAIGALYSILITTSVGSGVVQGTGNIGSGYSVNYDYYYVLNSGVFATGKINSVTISSALTTSVASGVVQATGTINSPTFQLSYTYIFTSDYLTTEAGDRLTTESGLYLVTLDGGGVAGYGYVNPVTAVAPPISLTVPSGVVTSTIQINSVVAFGSGLTVLITGVSATGAIGKVVFWGNIRTAQTSTWGAVTDAQTPGWGDAGKSQTPSWGLVPESPSTTWDSAGKAQTPGWTEVAN